jgi:hypothetical protein
MSVSTLFVAPNGQLLRRVNAFSISLKHRYSQKYSF